METLECIMSRRSVRQYKREPIPAGDMRQIVEAGRQAPSAANRQPWHFVVVGDADQRQQVAEACNGQSWMADAAYIIVACARPSISSNWYRVDVAIAVENMVLAAKALGYGTCWIGAFDSAKVKSVCGIPDDVDVVACTPLGVPGTSPEARQRKSTSEVFSLDSFGNELCI